MNTAINFLSSIQDQIVEVENRMRFMADGHREELRQAIDHLISAGGKRIRPAVALLTGNMFHADHDRLVALSAAIELLHTATLVHDDLIDGALLRRGNATLNAKWSPAATVLTGDYIFANAAKLAAETGSVELMKQFALTLTIIVNGEIKQLFSTYQNIREEEYYSRIYAKTASLFELATSAAAHLGGVDGAIQESTKKLGLSIGMAFQIVDDILDFTGKQETIGKPVASDLRQGIITFPVIIYLQSNPDDTLIEDLVNKKAENMDQLVADIRSSGAIETAFLQAQEYIQEAKSILSGFPVCPEREALLEISDYILERHK